MKLLRLFGVLVGMVGFILIGVQLENIWPAVGVFLMIWGSELEAWSRKNGKNG